ncbi:hypothetical protein O181_011353 [Austropuccinia psidii MF-1]|uniref:Uncharacterized protein n=1 Tax=Austropuccinia psidii MF-1 TaxID=1389203 RepID=A0A9Q3GL77_9BASI|nr:hypothetical protein [Austropuccinia psidii MF-1]
MQILTPVQDPNASHAKPCTVNPCAGEASRKCQHFLMLFQALNASHANPYAFEGSQQLKNLPTTGQPPNNSNTSLCWCRLPMLHMLIRTLVQVPNNSNNSLCWCRLLKIHTQILMLVHLPNASHEHPYACTGSQCFTCTSLRLYRLPKIQPIPHAWAASQKF